MCRPLPRSFPVLEAIPQCVFSSIVFLQLVGQLSKPGHVCKCHVVSRCGRLSDQPTYRATSLVASTTQQQQPIEGMCFVIFRRYRFCNRFRVTVDIADEEVALSAAGGGSSVMISHPYLAYCDGRHVGLCPTHQGRVFSL